MSAYEDLAATVADLQRVYETARDRLAVDHPNPALVTDHAGHFLLLDALTALVQARTALLNVRPPGAPPARSDLIN